MRETPAEIIERVAAALDLSSADLCGPGRTRQISEARGIAILVLLQCRKELSLRDIGHALGGRHHTTIIHARDTMLCRCARDVELRALVGELCERPREAALAGTLAGAPDASGYHIFGEPTIWFWLAYGTRGAVHAA